MEAFSLLKLWRNAAGDDATGGGSDTDTTTSSYETITTTTTDGRNPAVQIDDESDDDESFFDLEFTAPGCEDKEQNHARDVDINGSDSDEDSYNDLGKKDGETGSNFVDSPNDVFFKGRGLREESNSKPQSPISFLRSPPKFGVFMLFKKPKLEKTETTDVSPVTPKLRQQSKRFNFVKVEEVPILSLLTRVNSSRSKLQKQSSEDASSKRYPKDVVQKYLKLIKPLYIRVSKRYSEKPKASDEFSTANPSSSSAMRSPSKQAQDKQGSLAAPIRVVCKQLGKSRSTSSGAGIMQSPASKRDDSLLLQHDGIQSAILHCKRSYNSSKGFSVLSLSASNPTHEISVNPSRTFAEEEEEEKKRSSI